MVIYACNKNVTCGFGKVIEELSLADKDENDPLSYLADSYKKLYSSKLLGQFEDFWKRSSATREITTAPYPLNDALQQKLGSPKTLFRIFL